MHSLVVRRSRAALRVMLGRPHPSLPVTVTPRNFEEQLFAAFVQPGDVVYDIGANRGATALLFARLAGPAGAVCAFEPLPPMYAKLCRTVQEDTSAKAPIFTFPIGVSDSTGMHPIAAPGEQWALASLRLSADAQSLFAGVPVRTFHCQFRPMDDLVSDCALPKPQFVKIDVEGAELLVLMGARRLLEADAPVIHLEVFAPWLKPFGATPDDVLGLLRRLGYELWFACPDGLVRHEASSGRPFPPGFENGYNVLALHGTRHAALAPVAASFNARARTLLRLPPPPIPNVI
jgi:FkbM family methyltransferase